MRPLGRLAIALALGVVVQWIVPASLVEATAGRDFSRCIQACNAVRKACDDRCTADCRALFPSNKPQRDACIAACKAVCLGESDECKIMCQAIKNPPTVEEP